MKGTKRSASAMEDYKRRAFEAASRRDRLSGWRSATGSSANTELRGAIGIVRDRARDLARNDAYARRAIDLIQTNVVGTGIQPQLDGETEIERVWKLWAGSTECDADGQHDIYGLQRLAMRAVAESGEVLVRIRPRRPGDRLTVPMQLQVLEADHLATEKDGPADKEGHRWVQGIEIDAVGRRTGFWLHRTHPGDDRRIDVEGPVFVPAESVLHIYRMDRPGQMRGVPWAAPVVIRSRELKDYEDAQLLRQKLAACYVGFITRPVEELDPSDVSDTDGGGEGELGVDRFDPGMIMELAPGQDVTLSQPPGVQGYDEFVTRQLRAIAVGFGVSYEALTGDYSRTNFSSGRMGHLEFHRNLDVWQHGIMVSQFCRPVWQAFQMFAMLAGYQVPDDRPEWTTPRRDMIDPTKEVAADIQAVRAGFMTLGDVVRSRGGTLEDVLTRRAVEVALAEGLGLTLESDPTAQVSSK